MKFSAAKLMSRRKLGNLFLDVNLGSRVRPTGQALGTTSDPSIFTRNPEGVAPGHGQGPSRGVGCYSLIIFLKRKKAVRVGKLGVALFPKGTYVYTGSAMGGLAARLKRHLTRKKKIRWHIDYLLKLPEARVDKVIGYPPAANQECRQNQRIAALPGAAVILKRFGASDCKSGCASHLFFFGSSGFSVDEFSPRRPVLSEVEGTQRGRAATKMRKVGFTTKAWFDVAHHRLRTRRKKI